MLLRCGLSVSYTHLDVYKRQGMHWAFALGYMIMAIVADFVAGAGQYKSKKLNSLSYILFSLGGTGSYIVFFVDPNGWAQTMLGNGTEQSYIDTMQATANTGIPVSYTHLDVYKRQIWIGSIAGGL